ncbi:hypothetical protein [Maribacter litoralis]|uniref:hypothetical protein n=1 Tax=Maribacter litoralis TaxID=2059726 RepID=UPI003F5CBF41
MKFKKFKEFKKENALLINIQIAERQKISPLSEKVVSTHGDEVYKYRTERFNVDKSFIVISKLKINL